MEMKAKMENYLDRFATMVEELKSCSDKLVLLNYNLFEPASVAAVANVESKLGFSLDESVKDFFCLSNGLQLRWILKNDPNYNPETHRFSSEPFDWLDPWRSYLPDTGLINILPLEEIFFNEWKDYVWSPADAAVPERFLGVEYNGVFFGKNIKPFDAFGKFYSMVFFIGDKNREYKVVMGDDHLADFKNSKVTNFESYLEFLLATRGIVEERKKFYLDSFGSSAEPKEILITDQNYWQDRIVDIC
jgi:hypothetical protein